MKKDAQHNTTGKSPEQDLPQLNLAALQEQLDMYEEEKNVLLELSTDITKVREKNDLIKVFSSRLKSFFYFTHAVVSLTDQRRKTYHPFLIDTDVLPIRHREELPALLQTEYLTNDPFIRKIVDSEKPVSFLLDEIMEKPGVPAFIRVNYECGIKRAMIARLKSKMETIGYVFIYSDREDDFSGNFKEVLHGITPHLSNAVSNVIINEKIEYNEKINRILLSLSQEMVLVRDRSDLLDLIKSGLNKIIHFTHNVITVYDEATGTYEAFLVDPDSGTRKFSEYDRMIKTSFPFNDGILDVATASDVPVVFDLTKSDPDKAPLWVKLNYRSGAREMLIKALPGEAIPKHTLILFSDRTNTFDQKAIDIIERVSSQLSTAISNISANEEIVKKERDKSFLLEFSQSIASARTKEELSASIHQSLRKLAQVKAYFIRMINEDGKTMSPFMYDKDVFYLESRDFQELLSARIPIDTGITGKVMRGNGPLLIDMADEVSQGNTDHYVQFWKTLGTKKEAFQKLIGIPLRLGDNKLGILWVITPEINTVILEGISAQISVAISNIHSNEDIINREAEKSILLSITNEIADLRQTGDLLRVVNKQLKTLFRIEDFGFLQINTDGTYSQFMIDMSAKKRKHPDFKKITTSRFPVGDPVFERIMGSENPVLLDTEELTLHSGMPPYVRFWEKLGQRYIIGTALRVGGKNMGCAFFHVDADLANGIKMNLLKSVCAQISVAISNIRSNEEIVNREKEKSILLSISEEITALRRAEDLLPVVNKQMKSLFSIEEFGFLQIYEDGTYGPFMFEISEQSIHQAKDFEFDSVRYRTSDPVFSRVMNSEEPVIFDVGTLVEKPRIPDYVRFWKKLGYRKVLGTAMRVGGKNIGCAFFYIDTVEKDKLKVSLLKAVCNQISVAISNIRSNDEILLREEEKSKLLSLSSEIAALRSRGDLLKVVNSKLKVLFSIAEFGLAKIDEDEATYSAFVIDVSETIETDKSYKEVTTAKYRVTDPVFSRIITSEDPVLFDVNSLSRKEGVPAYVGFWKKTGVSRVLGMALRAGGKNIGCAFLHVGEGETGSIKGNLLKAVCAQLSVAVSNILANEQLLSYKQRLEVENDHLKEQIKTIYNFSDIIGNGPQMQMVYKMMSMVADSNSTTLILGETGTGKELIARAVHNASSRKDKLMIKVNCAALPANLIESELFGHEKGSFTGAIERRIGKFELAHNSTLFLDEIGEMPLETQVKLLRVIQERELERVGGNTTIKVDVRIIAATNRNLEEEVKEGRFRSDLYYRLNVFPISLPPLRERLEDLENLVEFFLSRYSKNTGRKVTGIAPKAMQELKSYLWPGNVRELEHLIERSVLLTEGTTIREIQLPKNKNEEDSERLNLSTKTLHQLERAYIIEILKRCNGKIAGAGGASELLDLPPTTLHSKIKKLDITKKDYFSKPV